MLNKSTSHFVSIVNLPKKISYLFTYFLIDEWFLKKNIMFSFLLLETHYLFSEHTSSTNKPKCDGSPVSSKALLVKNKTFKFLKKHWLVISRRAGFPNMIWKTRFVTKLFGTCLFIFVPFLSDYKFSSRKKTTPIRKSHFFMAQNGCALLKMSTYLSRTSF